MATSSRGSALRGGAGASSTEETGLAAERLYNLSRVETFYQHRLDEVALVPVFAAFVAGRRGRPHRRRSTTGSSGSARPRRRAGSPGRAKRGRWTTWWPCWAPAARGRRGRAPRMLARRIIPCLDVAGGRVVKGVHFTVAPRRGRSGRAGRPLRRRRRGRAGVPRHLRQPRGAAHHAGHGRAGGGVHLHPVHRGRRHPRGRRPRRRAPRRRRQGVRQHRGGARSLADLPAGGELRLAMRGGRGGRGPTAGRLTAW